jgi:hypothetical protein
MDFVETGVRDRWDAGGVEASTPAGRCLSAGRGGLKVEEIMVGAKTRGNVLKTNFVG